MYNYSRMRNEFFSENTQIRKYAISYIQTTSRYDAKALFSNTRELIRINIEHCSVKTERKRRRKMCVIKMGHKSGLSEWTFIYFELWKKETEKCLMYIYTAGIWMKKKVHEMKQTSTLPFNGCVCLNMGKSMNAQGNPFVRRKNLFFHISTEADVMTARVERPLERNSLQTKNIWKIPLVFGLIRIFWIDIFLDIFSSSNFFIYDKLFMCSKLILASHFNFYVLLTYSL